MNQLLGDNVPKEYIEQVIAEANVKQNKRVTYDDFLNMWRLEIEERKLRAFRGISRQRTVSALADEMAFSSEDSSDDDDDVEMPPLSTRLVSIAEIEENKSRSLSSFPVEDSL